MSDFGESLPNDDWLSDEEEPDDLDLDEDWPLLFEEESEPIPSAGLGLDCAVWIDGVRLTPQDCPQCLVEGPFDCSSCEFFTPSACRLLVQPRMRSDLSRVFSIYREQRERYWRWQERYQRRRIASREVLWTELRAHGRALHYTVLARMVEERYPKLRMTASLASHIMRSEPSLFEKLGPGVYRSKSVDPDSG